MHTAMHVVRRRENGMGMSIFILTDERIAAAFASTNFGNCIDGNVAAQRKLLVRHVLKRAAGYVSGYTLNQISLVLGLTAADGTPTKNGKLFMYNSLLELEYFKW